MLSLCLLPKDADKPENCPALLPSINNATTTDCRATSPIVDERVGQFIPLTYLPGCNGLWTDNRTKPACPWYDGTPVPDLVQAEMWYENMPFIE